MAGYQNVLWQNPSNSIVNILSPILHSYMIFTAVKLQYVFVNTPKNMYVPQIVLEILKF